MSQLLTIIKNEFYRYFSSPLALVYLIVFLFLNGSCTFYFGHWFERGQADLMPMFSYQPWIYLLFISGISMRLWAEEFRTRTILQLATLPIPTSYFVWGKFFAAWLFCGLALILTFPFWFMVNFLGSPDNMVILAQYLSSFILAGSMIAVAQTMSALSQNQIIALILAVIANLFFFLSGLESVLDILRHFFSPYLIDLISSFSFITHFSTMSSGIIEIYDLVFFASLVLLFNYTTILIISFRTKGSYSWLNSTRRSYYIIIFFLMFLGFCGINLIALNSLRTFSIDFTEEKFFTLSSSTRKVINNLRYPVTAKLYYSPTLDTKDTNARQMFDNIRLLLKQYTRLSAGKISLHIYNPQPFSNTEDRALASGLQPLPIISSNTNAYFGLVLTDERDNKQIIPFFPYERINFIEQDLTEAFYLLNHSKPTLGLITALPVYGEADNKTAYPKWEIINRLERFYNIVKLSEQNLDLSNIDILMLAHPQNLSSASLQKIKDYTLSGGKALAFFDIAPESLQFVAPLTAPLSASDYGDLAKSWGIHFVDKGVIADLDNSSFIDATTNYKTNPDFTQDLIQFYIDSKGFAPNSPITSGLKKMLLTSASGFAPLKEAPIAFEPLISASPNSQYFAADVVYNRTHPADILRNFAADNYPKIIAARITGLKNLLDIIVVGDSDLLYDNFWTVPHTVLETNYYIPILDNANFVLNALDVLRNENTLIAIRGKSYQSRPFAELEQIRRNNLQLIKIQEKEIFDEINKAKLGLQEIIGKRTFEQRQTFNPDELAIIGGIRQKINNERIKLFNLRNSINRFSDNLLNHLKFYGIYFIPLLLILTLVIPLFKSSQVASHDKLFNLPMLYIALISVGVFALGIVFSYLNDHNRKTDYEDTPLFSELPSQINTIDAITLQTHNQKLTFKKSSSGQWILTEYPHLLVYQNRIRNLLSALMESAYYEKKTNDLNLWSDFNLSPIENATSKATNIALYDKSSQEILNVNIGKYDIDLGRGNKGAYIRLNHKFQIWLAQMDLIDISLNPQNWTYSSLWNLQFGKIAQINDILSADKLSDIAKELLNIRYTQAVSLSSLTLSTPSYRLNIKAENNINLVIELHPYLDNYLITYKFLDISASPLLQNFATYAKSYGYLISSTDAEKLINVTLKPQNNRKLTQKISSNR